MAIDSAQVRTEVPAAPPAQYSGKAVAQLEELVASAMASLCWPSSADFDRAPALGGARRLEAEIGIVDVLHWRSDDEASYRTSGSSLRPAIQIRSVLSLYAAQPRIRLIAADRPGRRPDGAK